MNAFDLMAEAKMRQWETERKEGRAEAGIGTRTVLAGPGESFEGRMFADIKRLIRRAQGEEPAARRQTLREAEELQTRLSARLESGGYYRLSRYLFDAIAELRTASSEE